MLSNFPAPRGPGKRMTRKASRHSRPRGGHVSRGDLGAEPGGGGRCFSCTAGSLSQKRQRQVHQAAFQSPKTPRTPYGQGYRRKSISSQISSKVQLFFGCILQYVTVRIMVYVEAKNEPDMRRMPGRAGSQLRAEMAQLHRSAHGEKRMI